MKCEEAEALMAGLLLGEISPEDRKAAEEHLLECGTCRADFEMARRGGQVEWPDRPVPKPLAEAVLAAVRRPAPVLRFLRGATAAAAALAVAFLVLLALRRPKPEASEPPSYAAMMSPTGLGSLVARDEEGRPVGELGLRSHSVDVEILDGIARTTVEEDFENPTGRRLEGTFHFPLPPDASISRLALEVNGKIEEGTCLERERAREVFESIVRRMQDPALLEWMPGGIFKCRVFPIEPHSTKRVIVAYTQALPFYRGRMSYVYPLASEKTRTHPPGEVRIEVRTRFSGSLAKVESPSHPVDVQRKDAHEARATFSARNYRPEEDFVLSLEVEDGELRLVPHKTDGEDGYFALFVTPRGEPARTPRKYVFILDVSASVSGPELDAAKRLVRAMMDKAIPGDRFEILAHNVGIERSGEVDARGADGFLAGLKPVGGCDVLSALKAAPEGEIIYIGEGTPTIGEPDAARILEAVKGRRVRTVAVGSDANVTLLERMGVLSRISPSDHVARRVEEIASTMGNETIRGVEVDGGGSIYDVVGVRDLFYGERLAVVGRYRGPVEKIVVRAGNYRAEVAGSFPLREAGNGYVRRLWAQRKVADLLARGGSKDEVTALGVKYQIMTPYTSFLVLENEEMWKQFNLRREVHEIDEILGRSGLEFEEFALKRLGEAFDKGHKAVGIEAGVIEKMARAKGGEEGRRVIEMAEKFRNMAMSQHGGRMRILPSATPQEVEDRLRQIRDVEDKPAPRPGPPAPPPSPSTDRDRYGWRPLPESASVTRPGRMESTDFAFDRRLNRGPGGELDDGLFQRRERRAESVGRIQDFPSGDSLQSISREGENLSRAAFRTWMDGDGRMVREPVPPATVYVLQPEMMEVRVVLCTGSKLGDHLSRVRPCPEAGDECGLWVEKVDIGKVFHLGKFPGKADHNQSAYRQAAAKVKEIVGVTPDRKIDTVLDVDPRVPAEHLQGMVRALKAVGIVRVEVVGLAPAAAADIAWTGRDSREAFFKVGTAEYFEPGRFFTVTRDRKFVAIVEVAEVSEGRARAVVWRGMAVGPILVKDRAESVNDVGRYLAGLPPEVRLDLASRMSLHEIRTKMGVKP